MKSDHKSNFVKIGLSAVTVVLLASYFIYQSTLIFKDSYSTQIVMNTTDYEYYDTKGFVVRDEHYITNDSAGTSVTMVKNGERVMKGDTVCLVFNDSAAADNYARIQVVKDEITRYERLSGQANIQTADVSSINTQIKKKCYELQASVDSGDLTGLKSKVNEFRDIVTSLQLATGTTFSFQDKLMALQTELSQLSSSASSCKTISADGVGYYSGITDGFENTVSVSDIDSISVDLLQSVLNAKPSPVDNNVRGKLIGGFKWYFLCEVDNKYFGELENGDTVYVNLPMRSISKLPTKVYGFGDKGADKTVLVLECSMMNENLCSLRNEDLQIIINEHDGYKISSEAVRVMDGQQGVYVLTGNIVRFRKINVVYSSDNYVISSTPEEDSLGYVKLYDEVILKGEDLYDGKLIS